jgi:hypothetical protein
MFGSFERLRVGNAVTLTEKTLLSVARWAIRPVFFRGAYSDKQQMISEGLERDRPALIRKYADFAKQIGAKD